MNHRKPDRAKQWSKAALLLVMADRGVVALNKPGQPRLTWAGHDFLDQKRGTRDN